MDERRPPLAPRRARPTVGPPRRAAGTSGVPESDEGRYSVAGFVARTASTDHAASRWELENPRVLRVALDGWVWARRGSMVAYRGRIRFARPGPLEHGLARLVQRGVTGEGIPLMRADGRGWLYLADRGKQITILDLRGGAICVNGADVLALEDTVEWDIRFMPGVTGPLTGGLFNVHCSGTGLVAITTHHEPLTLRVAPRRSVTTDPQATVAWSADLSPTLRADVTLGTLFGRGSGEAIQMRFSGEGFVVVQPQEAGL
jgi:uncharacterized protein (AIM24 family)